MRWFSKPKSLPWNTNFNIYIQQVYTPSDDTNKIIVLKPQQFGRILSINGKYHCDPAQRGVRFLYGFFYRGRHLMYMFAGRDGLIEDSGEFWTFAPAGEAFASSTELEITPGILPNDIYVYDDDTLEMRMHTLVPTDQFEIKTIVYQQWKVH